MKRSRSVKLVLMGASGVALASCGAPPEEEVTVFETPEACIDSELHTAQYCRANWEAALSSHERTAPRYVSASDCYTDFGYGQCQRIDAGGGGFFAPFMLGYMVGNIVDGGARRDYAQPLYRSADDPNAYRTANNYRIGSVSGKTRVNREVVTKPPRARTRVVSRGGFGQRAAASRSNWSSGIRSGRGGFGFGG